ncbi:hypothetical protein [Streptomyces sp. NPDC002215]|uniref:hypothetical protein n=1 Tax=Streptomyces sp. NPDC002215 TaxID=3154412 RepID=UPI003319CF3B
MPNAEEEVSLMENAIPLAPENAGEYLAHDVVADLWTPRQPDFLLDLDRGETDALSPQRVGISVEVAERSGFVGATLFRQHAECLGE